MGRLDGRVAIVTGAAHGERAAIGSVYAKALAREGAKVTVADVKDCRSVADEIEAAQGSALALSVDVRDEASVQAMVASSAAFCHAASESVGLAMGGSLKSIWAMESDY